MYRDRTPLSNSIVAVWSENKNSNSCFLRFGTLGAQMLLFITDVSLLVDHTLKEGPAVITETITLVLICNKFEI